MRSHSSVLVIFWLVVLCCDVTGFSIRRRSTTGSDLTEAFRLLERQRRRIREDEYLQASRIPGPRPEISLSDLSGWEQGDPGRGEQQWMGEGFDMAPFEEPSYSPDEFDFDSENDKAVETVKPSKEEIENLFTDSEDSSDTAADVPQSSDDEEANTGASRNSETNKDDNLTEEEFKALMSAVEKLQKRALAKKDTKDSIATISTPDPQPVSKEELSKVFQEQDSDDSQDDNSEPSDDGSNKESLEVLKTTEEFEPIDEPVDGDSEANMDQKYKDTLSSIEKYWRLNNYFNPVDEKRRKRFTKRAPVAMPPKSVPIEDTYLQEIQNLRAQIQQLKLMAQLEDMENDALTQTLNEATLSQMEGTVSVKEFGSLEQAIKLEEAIQDLKNGKINPLIVELVAANALQADKQKRAEPLWKKEKRMDEADLEESYPMYETKRSQGGPVEGGFMMPVEDKQSLKRVQEHDVDRWYDRPARDDNSGVRDQYLAAQDAINDMVGLLAASEIPEEEEEEDDEDDSSNDMMVEMPDSTTTDITPYSQDSDSDQCPSDNLISDCAFADTQGLPIDDEARDLCNRHELCYSCGATVGLKLGECDNLYRGDAAILCSKDPNCVLEAELFLQQMKLKHRYSTQYRATCDNTCTMDFIGL